MVSSPAETVQAFLSPLKPHTCRPLAVNSRAQVGGNGND